MFNVSRRLAVFKPVNNIFRSSVSVVKDQKISDQESDEKNVNTMQKLKKTVDDQHVEQKIPKEMLSHFNVRDRKFVLDDFPRKLIQKKKVPDSLYLASKKSAKTIANALKTDLRPDIPIIEANPGVGLITGLLMKEVENDIFLYEPNEEFLKPINKLIDKHPDKNVILRNMDLNSIWRMAHVDKLDNGSRLDEALDGIPRKDYKDETNARLLNVNGSLPFVKHLINSVIFQSSLMSFGRCELFLCLSPSVVTHLTCSTKASHMIYRSNSVLFQLLFEYEIISKISRKDFLPWQRAKKKVPYSKLEWLQKFDSESMYLVRAVPRRDLYQYCLPENLPALWFFVKQHFISRKNRVIPTLERWIPNCGLRLTLNMKPTKEPKLLDLNSDTKAPTEFYEPCHQLSNEDFIHNINIYTEFGDLRPTQVLTLFDQFINWPEYQECSFGASLESVLMKIHSNPDETVNELKEEDDESKTEKSEDETKI